ncbi:unnamed protein product [Rotaria socialis]|uniref:Uncharacterized protein n=1 Tax=Rotaria socialis TaxID=392032 RepID=A0A818PA41_9BILA|nr:unnamed protein product [Rotaria socialis]CAF3398471.1 unnamed protein product [Rotaria socialis]CAF3620934.1 unnamed protein product [Rotaria socialis]CAF4148614.1 unnamed protein product [Rotaria socialis]CAF4168377.1 unnamed protein product [Rotaria socialis]
MLNVKVQVINIYFKIEYNNIAHLIPYIAVNSSGKSMLVSSLTNDDSTFNLHTIEAQSAVKNGLEIFIVGFKANVKLFRNKVKLFIEKLTFIKLD